MLSDVVNLNVNAAAYGELQTEGVVIGIFEGEALQTEAALALDELCGSKINACKEAGEIRGELKEFHIFHNPGGNIKKIILLGCGKRDRFTADTVRFLAAKGARTARKIGQKEVSILLDYDMDAYTLGMVASEGLIMGLDRFENYKSKKKSSRDVLETVQLLPAFKDEKAVQEGMERGRTLGIGNVLSRKISNHPPNHMTPTLLAKEAQKVAENGNMKFSVIDEPELIERGFEGITSVSKGSSENCKMIQIHYRGNPSSDQIDLAVVGKGLTFDAGGISIKPAQSMHLMKYDMCGGAGTIGAAYIVSQLKPKINVNFYIPSSENLCGADAYKPGDILNMYGGKTVEITNTDAEGRLLLADAIALAVEEGAKRIINSATLTGAVVGALGHVRTGLMCKDEALKEVVKEAAVECNELVWELPLDPEYKVMLHSPVADMVNSGSRYAGAVTAGVFLNEFSGDVPFCHLDIAGTAWVENVPTQYNFKPYLPKEGATGTVARTIGLAVDKLANA